MLALNALKHISKKQFSKYIDIEKLTDVTIKTMSNIVETFESFCDNNELNDSNDDADDEADDEYSDNESKSNKRNREDNENESKSNKKNKK